MKSEPFAYAFLILFAGMVLLSSCGDIIEPSISNKKVQPEAPADKYESTVYTINFWWDQVSDALTYHLQVVTPNFLAPGSLVLDTVVKKNTFSFTLNPGNYEWRVLAQNGSSQTAYTSSRSFVVDASSIKQQTVQLSTPANNLITGQSKLLFQWTSLYGATKYHFQLDTNNFANESTVVSDQLIPGLQLSFTFPKDQVYQWRIRAENDTAQSRWSVINSLTYDHTPPTEVSLVSPAKGQTVTIPVALQWNTVAAATRYKVYVYKSDSTTTYSQSFPLTVSTVSYSFNLGNPGDKVYWKVAALDAAGNEGEASVLSNFTLQ